MYKIGNVSSGVNNGANSVTISHTVGNNNDRVLIVAVHNEDATAGDRVVTGITFNGSALTKINSADLAGAFNGVRVELWYLLAPSVGTYNVVVSTTGNCSSLGAGVMDIYDAMQIAPEANVIATNTGATVSASITTLSGQSLVVAVATGSDNTAFTHGTGQTERWNIGLSSARGTCSTEGIVSGSAQTQSETCTGASRTVLVVASFVGIHQPTVNDAISIAENVNISLDRLNVNVLEPFYSTVTEHIDIIDLVVEVGIVMDAIVVSDQYVSLLIPILNLSYSDDISVTEDLEILNPTLFVDVQEVTIFVDESVSLSIDALHLEVFDTITNLGAPIIVQIDVLNVDVIDPFHCLITEHAQILDLVIELGVVMDAIYVDGDNAQCFIETLFVNVYDDIITIENISVLVGSLFLDLTDDVEISEVCEVIIPELIIEAYDNVEYDESSIEIFLDVLFIQFNDDVSIYEDIKLSLDELWISVQDDIATSEYIELLDEIVELEASDDVVLTDYAETGLDPIELVLTDDVSITEDVFVMLTVLNLDVQDPFGVLITEHADIIDAWYEVGVVDSKVYVNDSVSIYLDVLVPLAIDLPFTLPQHKVDEWVELYIPILVNVFDTITIAEVAEWLASISISAIDQISILEAVTVVRDYEISIYDSVTLAESVTADESPAPVTFSVNVFEQISISENRTAHLDLLFVQCAEQIVITEFINPQDIIIELAVSESITIVEVRNVSVIYSDILFLNVFDSVSWLGDFPTLGLDPLQVIKSESIAVSEYANIFDIIVELEAFDVITVLENISALAYLTYYEIDEAEIIAIDESAGIAYYELETGEVYDSIGISEYTLFDFTGQELSFNRFDRVYYAESVTLVVFYITGDIALAVSEAISVTEMAYLIMEGYVPRPPIIFDFERYPSRSITFEYESRTITLPY